jgi:hypothetical protein
VVIHLRWLLHSISYDDVHFLGLDYIFFHDVISSMIVVYRAGSFSPIFVIIEADLSAGFPINFLNTTALIYLADLGRLTRVDEVQALVVRELRS